MGLFIFDFWYGPSVLWQRLRTHQHFTGNGLEVTRTAEPNSGIKRISRRQLHGVARSQSEFRTDEVREIHRMRYFFLPELAQFLRESGFELLRAEEWVPAVSIRGYLDLCVVARKNAQ